jgi:hypothetical protein
MRSALPRAVWWTAFTWWRSGLPWNDGYGGWSAREVDPLIQVITTSSIRSNQHLLDQSRSSKLCMRGRTWLGPRTWHEAGAAALAGPAVTGGADVPSSCATFVPFPPKKCNTTHGTSLVSKICMKLVVYSSWTRGFDSRIFVVRTVNKLSQAKRLLVLEQILDLASVDQGLHGVITRQVPAHKLHALLAILKRLVWEKHSLTLPVGLLVFHLAFGSWKVEWTLTLNLSPSFSGSYLGVFETFAKKDKVP